jgi:arabinan endo-1,5-alpha-L-arabinosidase
MGGESRSGGGSNTGGVVSSAGNAAAGGMVASGGATQTGGGSADTGGSAGSGGASSPGGGSGAGGIAEGGTEQIGGSAVTGGRRGSGGATGAGGASDGMGGRTNGSGGRSGASGGGVATGGTAPAGGDTGTGGTPGAGGSDRCDVGVYDPATPPTVLPLSGSLGCHDPSAIAVDDTYYAFCTGLGAETSSDLLSWRSTGRPFGAPSWLTSAISGVGDLWAPDISQFDGKYHLYYAGSTFGSNKSCIGHATRDSLTGGSWTDDGEATICSNVDSNDNWNAIDPNLVVDTDGTAWLALGSFWSGLKIIQLDAAGKRVGTAVTSIANRPSDGGALEAPFIVRRCGYYYLFMSWDSCCKGASSTYNIRVVRGTSITGPYEDKAGTAATQGGGTLMAEGDSAFAGPGGQSVMFVGKEAYLVYHAYAKPSGAITLRMAELVWDSDGWPVPVGP